MTDLTLIRRELNKLAEMPPWGRPQGDDWDRLSNFVYRVKTLDGLRRQAEAVALAKQLEVESFVAYATRRWYNHYTHDQILQLFYAHPEVRPEANQKHRTVDFYFRDLPFDLKLSRFPRAYPETVAYARRHPHHLALWQYTNQSTQGRYHAGNRIFLVLHDLARPELSWQLRRDFDTLARLVQNFLDAPTLLGLTLSHHHTGQTYRPWTAVIFAIRGAVEE